MIAVHESLRIGYPLPVHSPYRAVENLADAWRHRDFAPRLLRPDIEIGQHSGKFWPFFRQSDHLLKGVFNTSFW